MPHHVSYQTLRRALIRMGDDRRLPHPGMLRQYRLDLTQFYPITADLHLVIPPAQELDVRHSVCEQAYKIAGLVKATPRLAQKRVRDESPCRQIRPRPR